MLDTQLRSKVDFCEWASVFWCLVAEEYQGFFMCVLDHLRAEQLVFRSNISQHSGFIKTMAHVLHGDSRQVFPEGLDRAWGLSEFGANDNSAAGGPLGTSGDGGDSSDVGASVSLFCIVQ